MSGSMKRTIITIGLLTIVSLMISGCLYRGDGIFKQIGDSDYKAKIHFMDMFVAADGIPTEVCGTVVLEDRITPLKNVHILLKKKDEAAAVAHAYTDNVGSFNLTGILKSDLYTIEIESADFFGRKVIKVSANNNNWHEVIALKR